MDQDELRSHLHFASKRIREGRVVPFLGAGVNLVGRPEGKQFELGVTLPNGWELAAFLADYFEYPDKQTDLVRVSQYAALMGGSAPLYEKLREVFDADYEPTKVHRVLADIPARLRRRDRPRYQVIVTTNYDDALERAFAAAGEEYDVVTYLAEGNDRGHFVHIDPDGGRTVIRIPNEYDRLDPSKRTVIVKLHGAINRDDASGDSFVITEDDYIDYLAVTEITSIIPITLLDTLKASHFLFLGYSLADWNLRVILQRIWDEKALENESWAVQLRPEGLTRKAWNRRGVEILDIDLADYVTELLTVLDQIETEAVS